MTEATVPNRPAEGVESPVWVVVLLGALVLIIALAVYLTTAQHGRLAARVPEILGVLTTLAIFSILYKENPVFRFVEHIFIGLAAGFGVVYTWVNYLEPKWFVPMVPAHLVKDGQGHWWLISAFLLGLLFFTVYVPRLSWMNRFALGILMGWIAGNSLQMFMGLMGPQIVAAFRPPVTTYRPHAMPVGVNNFPALHVWWHPWWFLALAVLLCTLIYFYFSFEHKSAWVRRPAALGRYLLMITLGAIFGTTVMGRFSLLIDRLDFVISSFQKWGHLMFH